jgi:nitrilase
MPLAAAIQMTSGPKVADNLMAARVLLESAARRGAVLAGLPENFPIMGSNERDKLAVAEADGAGPIQEWLAKTARELQMWIIGGTMPIRAAGDKVSAACLAIDATGRRVARYDKMHLFDVDIPGKDESYRESATIAPGNTPVVIDTPIGKLGMAVCYDMRFPELFRLLVKQGAQVLSLPAAFTVPTGQAHWDVLLRARAIENLCYVMAPAQVGTHASGRETYGNALIADPWGVVLDRVATGAGFALAEIDTSTQADVRIKFPALQNRKIL